MAVGVFFTVTVAYFSLNKFKPASLNASNNCSVDEGAVHKIVFIDQTDPWTERDRANLLVSIQDIGASLRRGEKLSLITIASSQEASLKADFETIYNNRFEVCSPGTKDEIGVFYDSPLFVEAEYRRKFEEPLASWVDGTINAVNSKGTTNSPIIETLELALLRDAIRRNTIDIFIFSDFRQNSELYSVYGNAEYMRISELLWERIGESSKFRYAKLNRLQTTSNQRAAFSNILDSWVDGLTTIGFSVNVSSIR